MKQGRGITHNRGIKDRRSPLVSIFSVLLSSQALVLHRHEEDNQHTESDKHSRCAEEDSGHPHFGSFTTALAADSLSLL